MSVVTVSPKFQVVIPRHIREALKLESGQKVQAFEFEGRVEAGHDRRDDGLPVAWTSRYRPEAHQSA